MRIGVPVYQNRRNDFMFINRNYDIHGQMRNMAY